MSFKSKKLSLSIVAPMLLTLTLIYFNKSSNATSNLKLFSILQKDNSKDHFRQNEDKIVEDEVLKEAYEFCKSNQMNTTWAVFADMSIHSGKFRLFVYDFNKDSVLKKGLVSHGCGDHPWGADYTKVTPVFSNVHESHCSSLGKYRIGKRGYSSWGIHVNYKLHGLEESNSNAYNRIIVLHSWDAVENNEVFPSGTPEGWGCPAVSNSFMKYLDIKLKSSQKPVLLWQYLPYQVKK